MLGRRPNSPANMASFVFFSGYHNLLTVFLPEQSDLLEDLLTQHQQRDHGRESHECIEEIAESHGHTKRDDSEDNKGGYEKPQIAAASTLTEKI